MKKKKSQLGEDIINSMKPALGLGTVSIGAGLLAPKLESKLPAGIGKPLTATATTTGLFVKPVTMIGVGNILFKQFKKLNKKLKGGKRKQNV